MLLRSRKQAVSPLSPPLPAPAVFEVVAQVLRDTADTFTEQAHQESRRGGATGLMSAPSMQKTAFLRPLTPREREVIELVVRGATDREIARDLGISTNTVNEYLMSIRRKIGAANRVSIATLYYGDTPYYRPADVAEQAVVEVAPAWANYVRRCISVGRHA